MSGIVAIIIILLIVIFVYSCIPKPRNSTCTSHDIYLNYTDDIHYLLQLEYEAVNYIEANVTNQYCRNYLKAALCVTIYPPCDNGVLKLCSEECNELLNKGACSLDTKHFTEHATNVMSNSFITPFVINCTNSLDFSNKYLNEDPCQSSKCISLTNIAEIPSR